ncbi:MAG: hypothetical protein N2652_02605 [Kiritimatiellae bacterium]|nr:hypothetical protein [Kiritimatiellia bacterium]
MNDPKFPIEIRAEGVDVASVVAELQRAVDARIAAGEFDDARVARAERLTLAQLPREGASVSHYLRGLRDAVEVDIGDFEIRERRARWAPLLVRLKRLIWTLLKFYTYRLWSQQNQINSALAAGLEGLDEQVAERLRRLEERVEKLERRLHADGDPR